MTKNEISTNKRCVKDILGNEWNVGCIGCDIASGEMKVPGGFIYDGKHIVLAADPEVPIPGFLIITGKRHVNSYVDLTKEERMEISEVIVYAEKALKELNIASEITLVQEERAAHFHIWILPTYDWMVEKFGRGVYFARSIFSYAKEHAGKEEIDQIIKVVEDVRKYFEEHNVGF